MITLMSSGERRGRNTLMQLNLGPSVAGLRRESVRRSTVERPPSDARMGSKWMVAPEQLVQIQPRHWAFYFTEVTA
jgi:hypothetical protein